MRALVLFANPNKLIISSPCPAVNNYIEKYFVELVGNLAEIVSPMVAMGRYLKQKYGQETKVVFIGPCVAKKSEYVDEEVCDAIDAVLTFTELNDEILEPKPIEEEILYTFHEKDYIDLLKRCDKGEYNLEMVVSESKGN